MKFVSIALVGLLVSSTAFASETVLLDNNKVKVTKVIIKPGETHVPSVARKDRVIIFLNDQVKSRHKKGMTENQVILTRNGHEVVWRGASSDHTITNNGTKDMESLLVEIK